MLWNFFNITDTLLKEAEMLTPGNCSQPTQILASGALHLIMISSYKRSSFFRVKVEQEKFYNIDTWSICPDVGLSIED